MRPPSPAAYNTTPYEAPDALHNSSLPPMSLAVVSAYDRFSQCSQELSKCLDHLLLRVNLGKISLGGMASTLILGGGKGHKGWGPLDSESELIRAQAQKFYDEWSRLVSSARSAHTSIAVNALQTVTENMEKGGNLIENLVYQSGGVGARSIDDLRNLVHEQFKQTVSTFNDLPSIQEHSEVFLIPDLLALLKYPSIQTWPMKGDSTIILLESSVLKGLDMLRSQACNDNATELRQLVRRLRELGDMSTGVQVSYAITVREVTYHNPYLDLALLSPLLAGLHALKKKQEQSEPANSLVDLGCNIAFSHLRARVYVVTSSLEAQKRAREQYIGVVDPDDWMGGGHDQATDDKSIQVVEERGTKEKKNDSLSRDILRLVEPKIQSALTAMNRHASEMSKDKELVRNVIETVYEALPFPIRILVKRDRFHELMNGWIADYVAKTSEGRAEGANNLNPTENI